MEKSKVEKIFQRGFMKVIEKMKKYNVPMPEDFRLYYLVEKYTEDDTSDNPDIIFKLKPCLTKEEADKHKEKLFDGKEKEAYNRTRETTIITNEESSYGGGLPWVEEDQNKQTIIFSSLYAR